ncbi:MAG: hypothetical protein ABGX10_14130 [Paracoccus sp. (in: a-proteobacteria)]|uniref:hypothetical protein n=1 Tax=Paracoccus sp. TaxID=267 RepID=UPI003241D4AA
MALQQGAVKASDKAMHRIAVGAACNVTSMRRIPDSQELRRELPKTPSTMDFPVRAFPTVLLKRPLPSRTG